MPGPPASSSGSPPADAPTDIDIAAFLHFLSSTTINQGIADDSPRRTLDVDRHLSSELYAPLSGASGFKKSRSVLDALVAVCMFGARICLALSVTLSASPPAVEICIAQNGTRPPDIVATHLQSIWTQLRAISELQKKIRAEYNLPDTFTNDSSPRSVEDNFGKGDVEPPLVADMWALKDALTMDIHRFCFAKTKRRVKKYLESFPAFYDFYIKNRHTFDVNQQLKDIIFGLGFIRKAVMSIAAEGSSGFGENGPDWERLVRYSDVLVSIYKQQDKGQLEAHMRFLMATWAGEPKVEGQSPSLATVPMIQLLNSIPDKTLSRFDLPRALTKMMALTTHIQELIRLAYSPRLRHILSYRLSINLLDPISHTPVSPPPSTTTTRIITRAFSSTSLAGDEAILADQLSQVATLRPWPPSIPVHAELTVLFHHHRHHQHHTGSGATARPFAYIAVSRLSCVCCWSFFASYTAATNRTFLLRGSHAKLYFPWWPGTTALEPQLAARMRAGLWDVLVRLFETHLSAKEVERRSDSTVASGEGNGHTHWSKIEMFRLEMEEMEHGGESGNGEAEISW